MKYLIKNSILILSILFLTAINAQVQNKLKTGFYKIAETENGSEIIKDIDSEDIFEINKNALLTIEDFSKVKFVIKDYKPSPLRIIEVKLTKEGRKKWSKIKYEISKNGESIFLIYNNQIYLEKKIFGINNLENSTININLEPKYQENIFQVINSEINNKQL